MKIDEKRKVIEVLLCCSDERSPDITDSAADDLGHRSCNVKDAARRAWGDAYRDGGYRAYHSEASTEAAYRLIESSPTLRREWFGGGR